MNEWISHLTLDGPCKGWKMRSSGMSVESEINFLSIEIIAPPIHTEHPRTHCQQTGERISAAPAVVMHIGVLP